MDHFEQLLDNLDAMVFSGDSLTFKANNATFKGYLERWERGRKEHLECIAEMEKEEIRKSIVERAKELDW